MRLGRAPDGGYFVPADLPDFDWNNFLHLDQDSRALELMQAFCPDLELSEQIEILALALNADAFPYGIYRVDRLNRYNERRFILELDRGASGFLHDYGMALHLAFAEQLGIYKSKTPILGPYEEEQRAFDAWRSLHPELELSSAVFLHQQGRAPASFNTVLEGDRHLSLNSRQPELSFALRELPADLSEQFDFIDGSSPAFILAGMIILASALADLAEKGEIQTELNLVLPQFSLNLLLASLYLKSLGAPIAQILLVNGQNHAVADFIRSGKLSLRRRFLQTEAAEVERLLPANLESLIFELCGRDLDLTADFFTQLESKKQAKLERELLKAWSGQLISCYATERRAGKMREKLYHETDYLFDTYSLLALAGLEHQKQFEQEQVLLLLCGRPWKGYQDSVAEIERLAKESGAAATAYCLSEKQDVEVLRCELAELKDLLLN